MKKTAGKTRRFQKGPVPDGISEKLRWREKLGFKGTFFHSVKRWTDFWNWSNSAVRWGSETVLGVFFGNLPGWFFAGVLKTPVVSIAVCSFGLYHGHVKIQVIQYLFVYFSYIFLVFWFAYPFLRLPFACTFALSSNYEAELRMKKHAWLSKCANKFTQMSRVSFWLREGCKWMRIFMSHIVTDPWCMFPLVVFGAPGDQVFVTSSENPLRLSKI